MAHQVSRVQLIKKQFESLSTKDDTSFICKTTSNPIVFKRSQTSFNLLPNSQNVQVDLRPGKAPSSNCSGVKAVKNKFQRQADDSKRASIKRSNAFRKSTQQTPLNANLTDTLKKALRQPLPKGPPPKKPPRTFESQNIQSAFIQSGGNCHQEANTFKSKVVRRNSHDLAANHPVQCNEFNNGNFEHLEPIYMEPMLVTRKSHSPPKTQKITGCAQPYEQTEELHYMVNSLVDAVFYKSTNELESRNSSEREPLIKLKRSITEKRKDYVRHSASKRDEFRKTIHTLASKNPSQNSLFNAIRRENESKTLNKINAEPLVTSKSDENLFTSCSLLGYDASIKKAYVKWKFPAYIKLPNNVEEFVFPSISNASKSSVNQNYVQIFTDLDGHRLFGYCRRVLPEASDVLLPLCYIMTSKHLAPGFYFQLLKEIESHHGQTNTFLTSILEELFAKKLPMAGGAVCASISTSTETKMLPSGQRRPRRQLNIENHPNWLKPNLALLNNGAMDKSAGIQSIFIRRPKDLRLESTELCELHQTVGTEILLNIFGTLLLERKVVLISENIARLSTCIIGLTNLLYPFQWQYPLVTCLPNHLMEICDAPIPLLIGCSQYLPGDMENAIIVDLDKRIMIKKCDDEETILPTELRKSLTASLDLVDLLDESDNLSNVLIAEAFLRFMVELLNNLHITAFDKSEFLESQTNASVKLFLEWFIETAMFHHFLTSQYNSLDVKENQYYSLFFNKLNEKFSVNSNRSIQCIEALIKNCYIINHKKSKGFSERLKKLFSN